MPSERWGSLPVNDHVDTQALVANVLLYRWLVVPVMTEQVDCDIPTCSNAGSSPWKISRLDVRGRPLADYRSG